MQAVKSVEFWGNPLQNSGLGVVKDGHYKTHLGYLVITRYDGVVTRIEVTQRVFDDVIVVWIEGFNDLGPKARSLATAALRHRYGKTITKGFTRIPR